MSEQSLERFESAVAAMPDTPKGSLVTPETVETPKSDLEKASEVFGMVEGLGGDTDRHMADLVVDANQVALDKPGDNEASDEARVADAAAGYKILEGGDVDDTARALAEQPEGPLMGALREIDAADPSGEAVRVITGEIDRALESEPSSHTLSQLREEMRNNTIDITKQRSPAELTDLSADLLRTVKREDLHHVAESHIKSTRTAHPNSHAPGLFLGKGPEDGVPMDGAKAYRSVDIRAVVDLIDSGVVRGAHTASGGEHAQTSGDTTYWSDGKEGVRHGFKAPGAFIIEAPKEALDAGWVTADKVTAVYTRGQNGELVNILPSATSGQENRGDSLSGAEDGVIYRTDEVTHLNSEGKSIPTESLMPPMVELRGMSSFDVRSKELSQQSFERKLGNNLPEILQECATDIMERFATPMDQRVGQEIQVGDEVYRPIMDITIDDEVTRRNIAESITQRKNAVGRKLQEITTLLERPAPEGFLQYQFEQLIDSLRGSSVLSPRFEGGAVRGALTDLYMSPADLEQYDQLDNLLNDLAQKWGIDRKMPPIRQELTESVIKLATLTFPSGVEFIHATTEHNLSRIKQSGILATRSTKPHGVSITQPAGGLNGGYVHLTPPGTVVSQYGEMSIGVPIDTIYRHSPIMHLEHTYSRGGYNQEPLAKFTINRPKNEQTTPLVFRTALEVMRANLDRGVQVIDIGQGQLDNIGFAATNQVETAGMYSYPANELHVYHITERLNDTDNHVNHVKTPSFVLDEKPLTAYAPGLRTRVDFIEEQAGNSKTESRLPLTLDTVSPDGYITKAGDLIDGGEDVAKVLSRAVQRINEDNGTDLGAFTEIFTQRREALGRIGIKIEDLFKDLNADTLGSIVGFIAPESYEIRLAMVNGDEEKAVDMPRFGLTVEERAKIVQIAAQKFELEDFDTYARRLEGMERCGYTPTQEQREKVQVYLEKKRLEATSETDDPFEVI